MARLTTLAKETMSVTPLQANLGTVAHPIADVHFPWSRLWRLDLPSL